MITLQNNEECTLEFDINDWIEFDYYNNSTHWKIEIRKIYFNKEWLLIGVNLETNDELMFVMKYMSNVKHY